VGRRDPLASYDHRQLLEAVFESGVIGGERPPDAREPELALLPEVINSLAAFNRRLAQYAIDNPDIGRFWLFDVLSRQDPKEDVFYNRVVVSSPC
jgi:hypothetical protein